MEPISFFMPMVPPTCTHQEKQVRVVNGKPVFYDPPAVKEARRKLTAHLAGHRPDEPITTGCKLFVQWCFPGDGTARKSTGQRSQIRTTCRSC